MQAIHKHKHNLIRLIYILLAVAPFLSLYVAHWIGIGVPAGIVSTGFIQGDMPYYSANGREIFERGNGFSYPNPYDNSPDAPAIYFQWLPWILGFGIKQLGLEPGIYFTSIGILSSLLCAGFMLLVVEKILPDKRFRIPLFFLVMWGGGILCLVPLIQNIFQNKEAFYNIFRYDPGEGWWFLNWGRNLIYPTEATYHAIVAATWLAVLNKRWFWVIFGGALLATTHPFSGLQLLLALTVWLGALAYLERKPLTIKNFLIISVFLTLFLSYYKIFLNSFPQHRTIQEVWSITSILTYDSMLLAYSPIGLIAACRLWIDRKKLDQNVGFLFTFFLISLFLAKHELFIRPMQPLHFTRGYIWTPLCLMALPLIQRLLISLKDKLSPYLFSALLVIVAGVAVSDNATFMATRWNNRAGEFFLTTGERQMLAKINQIGLDGILLSPYPHLLALAATYTSVRPYLGHPYLTPRFQERFHQIDRWYTQGTNENWFKTVDYILIRRRDVPAAFNWSEWVVRLENEELILLVRQP